MHLPPVAPCVVSLICASTMFAAEAQGAAVGSATLAYQNRVNTIVIHLVVPRLATQLDLLRGAGTVKLVYRVRANGEVESIKVSGHANRFVTDTCTRLIKSAKFPPIPKSVIKEQGHTWVDVDTDISFDR